MKYLVLLGDGMADLPVKELSGKTPLEVANKPTMDFLAQNGEIGLVQTVPPNMPPGSDVANLSVMGYNPAEYYTGRSPIEAVSMGLRLSESDVAVRCNLVCLSEEKEYSDKTMVEFGVDEVSAEEAKELISAVNEMLGNEEMQFYMGISYRHCAVWKNGEVGLELTPPHNISDKVIGSYLPKQEIIMELMRKSYDILHNHPTNISRVKRGLRPANSIWLWGEGTNLTIPSFASKYGLKGSVISAVDLLKGIGICAGMESIDVPGSTGGIDSDFDAEMRAAVDEFKRGQDFVFLHIEAPDECGHRGEVENKVRAIELIDEMILTPLIEQMKQFGDFRIMLLPDHATPVELKTHTSDAVPYVVYDSTRNSSQPREGSVSRYTEKAAAATGLFVENGHTLMDKFLQM